MNIRKSFASDNNSGVNLEIIKALQEANKGHYVSYGDDPYTKKAKLKFKEIFGKNSNVFFVYNGTGANTIALKTILNSYQAVICPTTAHINVDECGAPENFTGAKLIDISVKNGKLTPEIIAKNIHGLNDPHHSQPKVISITQTTELGTVYTLEEIKSICSFAHERNMYVHLDGARIANAAVALNCTFKEMTTDCGVDFVSFGATKNGLMFGEAILFLNPKLTGAIEYFRKQGMQLHSKMRFISAQFLEYFKNNLWKKNAENANNMAQYLYKKLLEVPEINITQTPESNAVFAILDREIIEAVRSKYFFYNWDEHHNEVRFMTSFDTEESDINDFVETIKKEIKNNFEGKL